uniref:Uncharacterized protein n=1 Tax=Zea mays TaxID=4577 RepID=C4J8K1_MAIZE|nr:unknown [Zea mays]
MVASDACDLAFKVFISSQSPSFLVSQCPIETKSLASLLKLSLCCFSWRTQDQHCEEIYLKPTPHWKQLL